LRSASSSESEEDDFSAVGCGGPASGLRKTIVYAEFLQETNSFSPVPTTERDFRAESLLFGEEVTTYSREERKELGASSRRWSIWAEAASSRCRWSRPVPCSEGYLSMHGAMDVEGLRDPEGDLLWALRLVVGPQVPIGVSLDLHANNTAKRARLATFRYRYLLYNRKTVNVMTPGLSNVEVFALRYERIPRPLSPLERIEFWRIPR
jgi:hypothetical protein